MLNIAGETLESCVKPELLALWNKVVIPAWFAASSTDKTPGKVRVTSSSLGVCALSARRMALRNDGSDTVRHSGISNVESNRKALTFDNFVKLLFAQQGYVTNVNVQRQRACGSMHIQNYLETQQLRAPVCLWKRVLRSDNISTLPLFYSVKVGVTQRQKTTTTTERDGNV